MIGADEAGTLAAMREIWNGLFYPLVAAHRGRVVKTMGDGALVEFVSAVDAVECAVAFQKRMAERNVTRAGGPLVEFRIGVNLGDIVIEGDDILGDGVNIAARLETRAPTNGVLVSEAVHAQVRGKVGIGFANAGALALKNIAEPVQAWVWNPGAEGRAAPVAPPASKASPPATRAAEERPSIAVLPFSNMSGDPEQEYFSDGISEDIITDLSKIAGLMVVARNSSFAYKGKAPDIRAVGRELGVTSVLEGSVRRAGNRIRINAQLIDARDGAHIWADRFDRDLNDIFAVQDEVTLEIVNALKVALKPAERARLSSVPTLSSEAHDWFLKGRQSLFTSEKSGATLAEAVSCFERSIALDPRYADPRAGLAMAWVHEFINRWLGKDEPLVAAAEAAVAAVACDAQNPFAQFVLGVVRFWQGDIEGSKALHEHALVLSPNFALALGGLGLAEIQLGDCDAAIAHFHEAIKLDPAFSHQSTHFLGMACLVRGDYEGAVRWLTQRIRLSPRTDLSRGYLASALGHLGRFEEARAVWQELREVNPAYSLRDHVGKVPFRDPSVPARILDGVRRSGIDV